METSCKKSNKPTVKNGLEADMLANYYAYMKNVKGLKRWTANKMRRRQRRQDKRELQQGGR